MATLLEHLKEVAAQTTSGSQNPVGTFRLAMLKRNISRPGRVLFEKGDYGLVPSTGPSGEFPMFCFRTGTMTIVGPESFEILPDDTPMPAESYEVLLAVRAPAESPNSPRHPLDHMPQDAWIGVSNLEEASVVCTRFFDTYDVTQDVWWGGTVRDAATCVPFATVRHDGTVWSMPDAENDGLMQYAPGAAGQPHI